MKPNLKELVAHPKMKTITIPVTQEHIDAAVAANENIDVGCCCIVHHALKSAGLAVGKVSFGCWYDAGPDNTQYRLGDDAKEITPLPRTKWKTVKPRTITVEVP